METGDSVHSTGTLSSETSSSHCQEPWQGQGAVTVVPSGNRRQEGSKGCVVCWKQGKKGHFHQVIDLLKALMLQGSLGWIASVLDHLTRQGRKALPGCMLAPANT